MFHGIHRVLHAHRDYARVRFASEDPGDYDEMPRELRVQQETTHRAAHTDLTLYLRRRDMIVDPAVENVELK